ncbi:SAV_6107 family HEPN domain-containing protein [Myceligenerans salitolerans]|uniref:Colicin transporter n=1 Tax=Myceligenerans salitolerans TaxID=1230528 RepID=A0ABS3I3A2_9MICO|nr:SAV_6107 family HEPN domain-containing protein [Myceligenerans salitolerans]MBO0607473.1 colicin transporter [Myceligenerans salitolerans]
MGMTQGRGSDVVAASTRVPRPVPPGVRALLRRADAELAQAHAAPSPEDRFRHAHLAAIRAAAAVLALRGRPSARSGARTVWDMLVRVEPDLAPWSGYFASGAPLRAAVDAGRTGEVDATRADEILACAEDFRDEVAMLADPDATFAHRPHLRLVPEVS